MIRIYLLIQAIIIAWMSAHSLSTMNHLKEEKTTEFEEMFKQMGKQTLVDQKQFVRKLSNVTSLIYIPYCLISFIYFAGHSIPMVATLLLVSVMLVDYLDDRKRIKQSQSITEMVNFSRLNRVTLLANLGLVAAQVGFLL